ncbi:hypothetical protein niasHT_017457 [Heterodera trifolii]|uniref:DNA-directed DNA polymerase n=1 Tax=Heterodera trifolii TaxID=157864 RepID=A0ABD2LFJ1_9BILA
MRDLNAKNSHLTTTLPANCPTSTTDKALPHIDNNQQTRTTNDNPWWTKKRSKTPVSTTWTTKYNFHLRGQPCQTNKQQSPADSATPEDHTAAAAANCSTVPNCDGAVKRQRRQSWDFKSMAHFEDHHLRQQRQQQQQHPESQTIPMVGDGPTQQQRDDGADSDGPSDHIEEENEQIEKPLFEQLQYYVHRVERFALHRHVTEFVLNGQHDEPEEALLNAFEHIIGQAIRNAENNAEQDGGGIDGPRRRVLKLGVWLNGKGLTDPIVLPVRPPEQNTAEVLMAELDKLGQSDGDEDVHGGGISKRSLLLSEPIEIIVTCIAPPVGAAPRFHPYQHWGYDERHMIRIFNTGNNFCLFYALIATRAYTDAEFSKSTIHQQATDGGQTSYSNGVTAEVIQRVMRRADFCSGYEALNRLVSNRERMKTAAKELMCAAEIEPDQEAYGMEHLVKIQQLWDRIYTGLYRIVLFTDQPEELPRPIWKGPMGRRFCVTLFLSDGHYHGIKKIHCFFKLGKKYCVDCECFYGRDSKHTISCKSRCYQCGKVGPQYPCIRVQGVCLRCEHCKRFFFSQNCFDGHRPQMCNLIKRCDECDRTFQMDRKNPHKCYSNYCARCKVYHEKEGACFIKPIMVPDEKPKYRMVCWDTETRLEQLQQMGQQRHKVNYLSARVTCTECCDSENGVRQNCKICLTTYGAIERTKDWSEVEGHEPISAFVEWILKAWDSKYQTFIWAHNASRFDGHFVLKYLGESKRRPEVIMNGLKIFEFRLQHSRRHSKLTWRDSCLLMPIRLEEMPKTFSLNCADKPFFPYAFNRRENYNVHLQHLPDKEDYCPGSMKRDKYEKFVKWYNENKNTPFYLPDELKMYCRNDTEILLAAVVQFRQILMRDITEGFDVLPLSATIASVCMTIFKGKFLNEKELAIVPEGGYERNDRASVFAIKYLDWRSKRDGVRIQHAGNGLEKRWRQFKLDGWIAEQNKCIEVLGCYWHGCESCFKPDDELVDGKTCRELNDATKLRLLKLQEPVPTEDAYGGEDEQGLDVEEIWECQIREQLKRDDEMRDFFDDLGTDRGPIDPRQTFYGGRTGPLQLIAEPKEDEKISVFDIVSLYPWVNYATDYPTGIPAVIHPTVEEMIVDWTRPEHLQYQGIYRVRVIPPKGLRIPVLPLKIDERLLFCCCHRCAAKFRKLNTRRVHKCTHTDEQRAFTGNFTHIELARALETGYRVDRFWRAWHYDEWSDGIFKDYVRLLIKLKVEASGFPDGANTVEQQQQFADEYRRIYNVNLDLENVRRNPGLRFISKLMLNSLWLVTLPVCMQTTRHRFEPRKLVSPWLKQCASALAMKKIIDIV